MKKRTYISPEAEVFGCKVNAMLMASTLAPSDDPQNIIPTDEEFNEEFSSHDFDFSEFDW